MKDITKQQELEYAVLSHLVQFADHTKRLIDIAAIEESAFSGDSLRAAFCTLIQDADTDPSVRLATARRSLPELGSDEFLDYFVGLAPSTATTNYCVRELLEYVVNRDLARTLTDIAARSAALSPEVVMSAYAEAQKAAKDRYEAARDALATVADASGDAPAASSRSSTPSARTSASRPYPRKASHGPGGSSRRSSFGCSRWPATTRRSTSERRRCSPRCAQSARPAGKA